MDLLQEAIRKALREDRAADNRSTRATARRSLTVIATEAQAFVEEARGALSDAAGGPKTDRRLVVGALLLYALDIAWSVCHMLRTEPQRTHMAALTLWRPLLETWLRASFFAVEATDDEAATFRAAGTIPMRAWPSKPSKLMPINPPLIAKLIGPALCPEDPDVLRSLVEEVKDWHGFVHGGDIVVELFDGGDNFESQVGPDAMALKVQRVAVIAHLCAVTGINLSIGERPEAELRPVAEAMHERIRKFQQRWPRHMFLGA